MLLRISTRQERAMRRLGPCVALGALILLTGCASRPTPQPAPAPPPVRPAPPPVALPPAPPPADWRDLPLSSGDWTYADRDAVSEARFAPAGGAGFVLSCDKTARRLAIAHEGGDAAGAMTVRTTSEARSFPAARAALAPADALLDAIAFSRGRFVVEQAGRPFMVLPAWPEAARVVEDCRG
jgi:hypothetical protein